MFRVRVLLVTAILFIVPAVCYAVWQGNRDSPQPSQSDQGLSISPEEIYDAKNHDDCRIFVGLPRCSRPNPNHLHRIAWNVLHYHGERLHVA
jgi:hypothetical protein